MRAGRASMYETMIRVICPARTSSGKSRQSDRAFSETGGGDRKRLFAADAALTRFELVHAQPTSSGALIATYRPIHKE